MAGETTIIRLMKEKYAMIHAQLKIVARDSGYAILINDVDDCIQDAYLLLYDQWERLKTHENLGGWLYLTARNNLMNRMRIIKGRGEILTDSLNAEDGLADSIAARLDEEMIRRLRERELAQDTIDQIKDLISPECYAFLLDYHSKQTNVKAVAEKYGTTEAGAWMRKRRMIDKIRRALFGLTITFIAFVLMACITPCSEGRFVNEGGQQQIHAPSGIY